MSSTAASLPVAAATALSMATASASPSNSTRIGAFSVKKATSMAFLALLLVFSAITSTSAGDSSGYPVKLRGLYVSHGTLTPAFSPDVYDYSVTLQHAHDQIAVTPEIDQTIPAYQATSGDLSHLPLITLKYDGHMTAKPESSSVAVRKQIDIPDDGSDLHVYVVVADPNAANSNYQTYTITVHPSKAEPVTVLKDVRAVDNLGSQIFGDPVTSQDDSIYAFYVNPDADSVTVTPYCSGGNWVTVDGNSVSNEYPITINREKDHYRQVVEVVCGKNLNGEEYSKRYVLMFMSEKDTKDDLEHPRVVVDGRGRDCTFLEDKQEYNCPNPRAKDYRTRLISFSDPSVRYTVENPDGSVNVRLLNEVPSIPFSYNGGNLAVVGLSGRKKAIWPLHFNGAAAPGLMSILGWILGLLLLLLLLSLLAVLGLCETCGIGTPIGVTEIATAMTMLQQWFCFGGALRGSSLLNGMADAMRWVTLFWPVPWKSKSAGTDQMLKSPRVGDVTDLHNAYGCLVWAPALLGGLMAGHGLLASRFMCCKRNNTYPHRMKFGNWENRALHWLAFPACVASGMVLKSKDASKGWKGVAGITLAALAGWAAAAFASVKSAVSKKKAIWVWHSSVREDGELEDESGYWSDVVCDQVLSQPVNRSLCKWFFPWRWVSTVADIDPVDIDPRMYKRQGGDEEETNLYPVNHYNRSHKESGYPLGKNPKTVDVIKTVPPCKLCPGNRLVAGLFRTQWLDLLFTMKGLTQFHSSAVKNSGGDFVVPLTVKTCQLTGPVTGGRNHFFFDGTRSPFARVGDALYRIGVGVCLGIVMASTSYGLDAWMYGLIAATSLGMLVFHILKCPYSRRMENYIVGILLATVALSALAFMIYAIKKTNPSVLADICMWICVIAAALLSAYAVVVLVSIYSAVMCPPLEETRFLEKLANCNVTVSDPNEGWSADMPAYSKYPARDLKAKCGTNSGKRVNLSVYPSGEEPNIEFDSNELVYACRSGNLAAPAVSLFCPDPTAPLRYRHRNIYDKGSVHPETAAFLAEDRGLRSIAEDIARTLAHHVETRCKGRSVTSITVVPPSGVLTGSDPARFASNKKRGDGGSKTARSRSSGYASIEMSER